MGNAKELYKNLEREYKQFDFNDNYLLMYHLNLFHKVLGDNVNVEFKNRYIIVSHDSILEYSYEIGKLIRTFFSIHNEGIMINFEHEEKIYFVLDIRHKERFINEIFAD